MINQELLTLASKLILASTTGDENEVITVSERLANQLKHFHEEVAESHSALDTEITGFLKFTNKEISKMPKSIRRTFIAEGQTICYRRRKRGKVYAAFTYEARYRRHGYNISVSAANLEDLKTRFIEALHADEYTGPKIPTNFHEFSMYYFENFRKRKVKPLTYKNDLLRYNNHLKPTFEKMPLRAITPMHCQKLIDGCIEKGHNKTADEVYSLLNVIFKMAIAHNLMQLNPLSIVVKEAHEREHGSALTKDEEKLLLTKAADTEYQLIFALALYTGMRPNEYDTARIDGDFIICINSKRKNKKVEYKKIPISVMLAPYLVGVVELRFPSLQCISKRFKKILPNHRLYDLRTTFYTRCQECGVADVARMEFVGHSLGALGDTYTDLSDEFLLKEGEKLNY